MSGLRLYTAQHRKVLQTLASGDTYFPEWAQARPFNAQLDLRATPGPYSVPPDVLERMRPQRQRAYRFMAEVYASKKAREGVNALVYCFLDRGYAAALSGGDDVLLALCVPDSEVLLSQHTPWSVEVLAGAPVFPRLGSTSMFPKAVSLDVEESWHSIFQVDGYDGTVQGVLDRIEPKWVVEPDLRE